MGSSMAFDELPEDRRDERRISSEPGTVAAPATLEIDRRSGRRSALVDRWQVPLQRVPWPIETVCQRGLAPAAVESSWPPS